MNHFFIGGTSGSGKSTLASKVAKKYGLRHEDLDLFREEMKKFPEAAYWVNFFWNQNPKEYWINTTPEEQWSHIVKQSESFWPHYLRLIEDFTKRGEYCVFESVNILPHLAKSLPFPGVYLVCDSVDELLPRYLAAPRWSTDPGLIKKEVEDSVLVEAPRYREEALRFGFPVFNSPTDAEREIDKILSE